MYTEPYYNKYLYYTKNASGVWPLVVVWLGMGRAGFELGSGLGQGRARAWAGIELRLGWARARQKNF